MHALRPLLQTRMNLEMGLTDEMLEIAVGVRPQDCCLVPENRAEITTEGGLDVAADVERVAAGVRKLAAAGIRVALFIAPDLAQIEAAKRSRRAGHRAAHRHLCRGHRVGAGARARAPVHRRQTRRQSRARSARRPWPHLQQRGAGGRDPRDRRAQHRPLHHRARDLRRPRSRGARHEGADGRGAAMIFGIGVDVLEAARIKKALRQVRRPFRRSAAHAGGTRAAGQNAANRAVSRHAFRRQGSHRQGHGHGLRAWHLDSRRGRGAERLGPARSGLFAARRKGAPQARHRRRSRHAHRRSRAHRRGGGARDRAEPKAGGAKRGRRNPSAARRRR